MNEHFRSPHGRIFGYTILAIIAVCVFSLCLDGLHIWWWLGIPEPQIFQHWIFTGIYGRPDHNLHIFIFYAFVYSCGFTAFTVGWFNMRSKK